MMKRIAMILALLAVGPASAALLAQEHDAHASHARQEERDNRDAGRWYWQMPNRVITEIGVRPGMIIGDVGAGDGYFTLRLAQAVGKEGKIYANDIDHEALKVLQSKAAKEGLVNITVVQGGMDDPKLPPASLDLAIMVNVIHYLRDKEKFLTNLKTSLKPGGSLIVVQWDAEKMDSEMTGWDPENRAQFTKESTRRWLSEGGYKIVRVLTFLPMQNIYICRPL